jgi:tetratricopeptide (TPR) repeat protein
MILTGVLIMLVGFSGYAVADWSMAGAGFNDDPDAIPVFKHWEQKMGKKQFTVCMKADTSQPAVQERCGDQLGELCWSIKSKKDGLTCKGMANLLKILAYAALMERAIYRGDRRAYNYYEDKYTSAMAVNIHLDQLHEQSEGSRLNEKKRTDAENKGNEHFERGLRNMEAGKYKDAITDFSNYIRFDPHEATAYYNRGKCYVEVKNPEKALPDYSKAIEINAQDPDFFSMRGSAYQDLKKFKEAVADYTKAIELGAHDAAIYENQNLNTPFCKRG